MTNTNDLHPLTIEIAEYLDAFAETSLDPEIPAIDEIVRARLDREPVVVESGVRFVGLEDTTVEVAGTFIESGNQLQMALIGSEPVLLVQPNYDADENHITLIVTAVDLPPAGLVQTLEVLLDGAKTVVAMQAEQRDEAMITPYDPDDADEAEFHGLPLPAGALDD